MPAVALTDHANMMGAFHFVSAVSAQNKKVKAANEEALKNGQNPEGLEMKPIVGCEFFVCENHENKTIKETLIKLSKCATKGLAVVNSSKKLIGVISDGDIRKKLIKVSDENNFISIFPDIKLCGDNAAMIALVGLEKYKIKKFHLSNLRISLVSELL